MGASTAFHPLEVGPRKGDLERVYDIPPTVWFVPGHERKKGRKKRTCQKQTGRGEEKGRGNLEVSFETFPELDTIDRPVRA